MADSSDVSSLERVADVLGRHGVEFIVVGGQAALLHGSPCVTYDIDLCYRRSQSNLRRLAGALAELRPALRGAPPDLPFRIDAESLALGCNYTFTTSLGDVDFLGWLEPLGDYDAIVSRAVTYDIGDLHLKTISLDDLIRIKEHINRPKDRAAARQLRAIRDLPAD